MTAHKLCSHLNELLNIDKNFVSDIFTIQRGTNIKLRNSNLIYFNTNNMSGVLGLLNGMLEDQNELVAAKFKKGKLLGFTVVNRTEVGLNKI